MSGRFSNDGIEEVYDLDEFDIIIIQAFLPLSVLTRLKKIEKDITIDGGQTTSSAIEEMKEYQKKLEEISK